MLTISFVSEEEKQSLIEQFSQDYQLIETRYLFNGNELKFAPKINGLTSDERLAKLEEQVATLLDSQVEDDGLVTETEEQTQTRLQKLLNFWRG